MKIINRIVSVFILILFMSCEGDNSGKGIIYDKATELALDSVKYRNLGEDNFSYSDSLGQYFSVGPFGGCVPNCPDYKVEFSKVGYKTRTIQNPDGTIYLESE